MWHNSAVRGPQGTLTSRVQIEEQVPLIDDFVDDRGEVLSFQAFVIRHNGMRVNPLWHIAWCLAIPNEWKIKLLGSHQLSAGERTEEPAIKINDKVVPLRLVKSSYFCALLIPDVIPTAQRRWVEEGPYVFAHRAGGPGTLHPLAVCGSGRDVGGGRSAPTPLPEPVPNVRLRHPQVFPHRATSGQRGCRST